MSRRLTLALAPALLAGFLSTCILTAPARCASPRDVLPPASAAKGWKMVGKTRLYNTGNLYQLINGEAEAVMRYAFSSLAHGEYAPAKAGQPALTIDVFDMSDPLNAFGLFSSSDRGSGPVAAIGAEGVNIGNSGVNFWKGRYVVRTALIGRGSITPANRAAQTAFAKAAAARITGASGQPPLLAALPPGRQQKSERYVRANVAGQSFLKNAVTARYPKAGFGAELFIAQYPNAVQAKAALNAFQAQEKRSGSGLAAWKIGNGGFTVRDRYMKDVAVALKGRNLVGIVRAKDAASAKSLVQQAVARVK